MWVDTIVESEGQEVRIKGSTDPVIVTGESEPLVVTEVKTKDSLDHVSSPNRHHRAQVHAHMHGLSGKYDRDVSEAVLIYGSRTTLDITTFHESFDEGFWQDVCAWAAEHTAYRAEDALPPPDPEYGWECEFCSLKHRCGESDEPYADVGPRGLLPGFTEYLREQIKEYLEAYDNVALTPVLAHEFPELTEEFAVQRWECPGCETRYAWDDVDQRTESSTRPFCPSCADDGDLVTLRVETPQEMKARSGEGGTKVDM
jgi:CRISPR/Cas system-associated exonuclease Cas4 (RecB family)